MKRLSQPFSILESLAKGIQPYTFDEIEYGKKETNNVPTFTKKFHQFGSNMSSFPLVFYKGTLHEMSPVIVPQ